MTAGNHAVKSSLITKAIAILFFGLVFEFTYCMIYKYVLNSPFGLHFNNHTIFSDFYDWLTFPVMPSQAFFGVPPMLLLSMNICKWLATVTHPHFFYALFTVSWVSLLIFAIHTLIYSGTEFNRRNVICSILLVVFAYPVIYCFLRGNVAGFTTAASILGIYYYKEKRFLLSIIWIAVAVNFKLVPVLFLALPLYERRWLLVFQYIAATIFLAIFSFIMIKLMFYPEYTTLIFLEGLHQYYLICVIGTGGFPWGVSLFGAVRALLHLTHSPESYTPAVIYAVGFYNVIIPVLTLMGMALLYIKRPPLLQGIILLTCWFLLAPSVMSDYYLGMLFLPLALAIREGNTRYTILISLILIPKAFYIPGADFSTSPILQPLAIAILLLVGLWDIGRHNRCAQIR